MIINGHVNFENTSEMLRIHFEVIPKSIRSENEPYFEVIMMNMLVIGSYLVGFGNSTSIHARTNPFVLEDERVKSQDSTRSGKEVN